MSIVSRIIYYLDEMAYSKRDFLDKYLNKDIREKVIFHLCCCYLTGNKTDNYNHWKKEIYSFIKSVPILTTTNKYPTYKQLYSWDILKWSDALIDHLRGYISEVNYKEKEKFNYNDLELRQDLCKFILDYYNWLYKRLGEYGVVVNEEVYNEIDMLMSKYNREI